MQLTAETLAKIAMANGHEDYIILAMKLDNNMDIPEKFPVESFVPYTCSDEEISCKGVKFRHQKEGLYPCRIIEINRYSINRRYLVEKPNREKTWVSDYYFNSAFTPLVVINPEVEPETENQ